MVFTDTERHDASATFRSAAARGVHGLADVLRACIGVYTEDARQGRQENSYKDLVRQIGECFPLHNVGLWCTGLGGEHDGGHSQHLYTCATMLFGLDRRLETRTHYVSDSGELPGHDVNGIAFVVDYEMVMLRSAFVDAWSPKIATCAILAAAENGTLGAPCFPWCRIMLGRAIELAGRGAAASSVLRIARCVSRGPFGLVELGFREPIMRLLMWSAQARDRRLFMRVFMAGSPCDTHLGQWKDAAQQMAVRDPANAYEEITERLNGLVPQIPVGDLLDRICAMIAVIATEYHSRINAALVELRVRAGIATHSDSAKYFVCKVRAIMLANTLD